MPAEIYACTVPRCIELMKIARQFKNLPLDYEVGDEVLPHFPLGLTYPPVAYADKHLLRLVRT